MDVETYVRENILITGEEIAWRGRPNPKRVLRRDIRRAVFGIFFFGFSIFWTVMATHNGGLFGLVGIPFIVMGGWLVTAPFRERHRASHTYYAVTNERALIIEMGREVRTTSIAPDDMIDLERVDRADGFGDLQFRRTKRRRRGDSRFIADYTDGFWGTADIKGAAQAVNNLLAQTREPATIE